MYRPNVDHQARTLGIWKGVIHHVSYCFITINEKHTFAVHSAVSDSFRPHGLQHARLPCPSPSPGVCSNACPMSRWCHPSISSSVIPFSSCPQTFQLQSLFQWVGSSHQVAKGLELQHQSFQGKFRVDFLHDWLVWSPCSPRDSYGLL